MPEKCQHKSAVCIFCMFFHFLAFFFRNHVCPVSPVLFFPLWQFIIFNDETRTRVSDKHVLYTVPLHTFVVITRKTQVSEWALGLQRGRLFIFLGCLVVYIFLFFASSELKDAAKLFQTKKSWRNLRHARTCKENARLYKTRKKQSIFELPLGLSTC